MHSYETVPYYKKLFDDNKIKPADIKSVDDLHFIPVLTKKIVRDKFDDLISKKFQKYKPYINRTSGSTGTPLKFYQDRNVNIAKFVFLWRAWNWAGYKIGDKMVQFEGALFDDGRLYDYDRSLRTLRISSFKLTKNNSKELLKIIHRIKPKMIRAYPPALFDFARYIENENVNIKSLKTIVTLSESLREFQRKFIEKVFKVRVYDLYHQWESICMISECEKQVKHHHMEYGVLEVLDKNNNPVQNGESGEFTATGFYNLSMPLIRYKTRDIGCKDIIKCNCGRAHDVIKYIDGRIDDLVLTPDGRRVWTLNNSFKFNKGFDYAQIIQNKKDKIIVKLVKNNDFDDKELKILDKHLKERIGDEIIIDYIFVDQIERSSNGKMRLVINNYIKNLPKDNFFSLK